MSIMSIYTHMSILLIRYKTARKFKPWQILPVASEEFTDDIDFEIVLIVKITFSMTITIRQLILYIVRVFTAY